MFAHTHFAWEKESTTLAVRARHRAPRTAGTNTPAAGIQPFAFIFGIRKTVACRPAPASLYIVPHTTTAPYAVGALRTSVDIYASLEWRCDDVYNL